MTRPRCIIPGKTHLITRRCSERRFFLRPDEEVTHIFRYLLAVACQRYGVQLHAFVAMSNHYHLVATDTRGRLPDFEQYLNSRLARAINRVRGREESIWDRESYNSVELVEEHDVVNKIGYTLMNPVNAFLVTRARNWKGATSAAMRFGVEESIERPRRFFGKRMPKRVSLQIVPPPAMAHRTQEAVQAKIFQHVNQLESQRDSSKMVLGMDRVLAQDWNASPATVEQAGCLKPTIAAKRKWARIDALRRRKDWLERYYEALKRFCSGDRDVEWPLGTWKMCAKLGCPCAAG